MNVPEKHRAVAHAWIDGSEIEYRIAGDMEWGGIDKPTWGDCYEYRIKPKAKVKKWRWVDTGLGGLRITSAHWSEAEAVNAHFIQKIDSTLIEVDE